MKILEELWYGNVTPGERSVEKVDRLWNLGKLILQNEEELAPLLSEKAKEVLEKLRDNQSELNDLNECEVFVCGFRLGARIMLEVLDGSDKWGRVPRIDLVPRVRLHTNPSSKQIYRPTEKRFAPKCRTNLGKHRSAASRQR